MMQKCHIDCGIKHEIDLIRNQRVVALDLVVLIIICRNEIEYRSNYNLPTSGQ